MKFFPGLVLSFLIGSFPTAYCLGKLLRGVDIRQHGSGNVGATNVFRVIGKKWGVIALIFDMTKGVVPAILLSSYFFHPTLGQTLTGLIYGLSAVCGHIWTPWLGFKGGKGVATSAGVFLALTPAPALVALIIWASVFAWKRYVSLASLATASLFPLWVFLFYSKSEESQVLFPVSLIIPVFIFYTHRGNIQRLREGTEKRLI